MEQPTRDLEDNDVLEHILSDVMTTPSTHIQIDQVGARLVDRETNTSAIDLRPQREGMRIDIKQTQSKSVQVPTSHSDISSNDTDIAESSLARLHIPDVMPQLDGPTSIRTIRRPVQEFFKEQPQYLEEDILMRVIVILMIIGHLMNGDTMEGEDIIRIEVEDHQIEEMTKEEAI